MKHSTCRDNFLRRRDENEAKKAAARETGERLNLKRQPKGATPAHSVTTLENAPQRIFAMAYAGLE